MSFNQNASIVGLNSYDIAVPTAGAYFIQGNLQLPRISQGSSANSSCVVTITNRTGPVTLYTGTAGADGFYLDASCAAGDVLRVALTSAAAVDTGDLNAIKCEIACGSGQ